MEALLSPATPQQTLRLWTVLQRSALHALVSLHASSSRVWITRFLLVTAPFWFCFVFVCFFHSVTLFCFIMFWWHSWLFPRSMLSSLLSSRETPSILSSRRDLNDGRHPALFPTRCCGSHFSLSLLLSSSSSSSSLTLLPPFVRFSSSPSLSAHPPPFFFSTPFFLGLPLLRPQVLTPQIRR